MVLFVFVVCIGLMSLVNRSVIMATSLQPRVVFRSSSGMSIATYSNGPARKNSFMYGCRLQCVRFFCAEVAITYSSVDVTTNIGAAQLRSHEVVHSAITGGTDQNGIETKEKEAGT